MHGKHVSRLLEVIFITSVARAALQDMDVRKQAKQMEMLWRGAKSFGDTADVFTSNFPTGMCKKHLLQYASCLGTDC